MDHLVYYGQETLCLCLDIGATMSAVALAQFEDNEVPNIRTVNRWPGQEEGWGDCKVPSVVRYDSQGRAVQFGTEAIENKAGFVNTTLVKCFTHHLYPAAMRSAYNNAVPPLPYGVAIKKIYTDFLKYLFEYTQDWVKRSTTIEWDRLKNSYVLVMAIPNGWDGTQQAFLRSVVVDAGALPANHGPNRLRFVSKAEASIHFAAGHEGIGRGLRQGSTIAVCNAGGSTVNTSVYACTSAWPTFELREVTSNECVQAGGIFVDEAARQFLEHKLASSTKYGTPKTINDAVYEFERKTKRRFDGQQERSFINFGSPSDHERPLIANGRIILTRDQMESFFKAQVTAVAASIEEITRRSGGFDSLLLVGGFAESSYLRTALDERLRVRQITIDSPTYNAAVEGAVAWFAKRCAVVSGRAARTTYGIEIHHPYDEANPAHRRRSHLTWLDSHGERRLGGIFSPLIVKDDIVCQDESVRKLCHRRYNAMPPFLSQFETEIISIDSVNPGTWCQHADGTSDNHFRSVCTLKADLSGLKHTLRPMTGRSGIKYLQLDFEVEFFFGRTSLGACLVWNEQGRENKLVMQIVKSDHGQPWRPRPVFNYFGETPRPLLDYLKQRPGRCASSACTCGTVEIINETNNSSHTQRGDIYNITMNMNIIQQSLAAGKLCQNCREHFDV